MLPFFILGNPRSGTSLFRLMLNSHPRITVPPECGFNLWLAKEYAEKKKNPELYKSFAKAVYESRKFETWKIDRNEIENYLLYKRPETYPDMVACLYFLYANKKGVNPRLVGDKNNYYMNLVEEINKYFPASKKIYVIRDVRDVICSYNELSRKKIVSRYKPNLSLSLEEIAETWNENVEKAIDDSSPLSIYIRYEDVLSNPQRELIKVCNHLEETYAEEMLLFYEKNDEPKEFLQWKGKTSEKLDQKNMERYKNELTLIERNRIEDISGEFLQYFGYK